MTDENLEATSSPTGENEKIILAYASLLLLAVRQELRASGAVKDPERLAELEAGLAAGTENLGIWVQGDLRQIFISAAAVSGKRQDPFVGNARRIHGPLIFSREQLAALGDGITLPDRASFN